MRWTSSVACVVAVTALGCGSDGGGGSSSGVDKGKQLNAITDEDAKALCRFEQREYTSKLPDEEAYCTFFAQSSSSVEGCEQDRDACIATSDYEEEVNDDWECDTETVERLFEDDKSDCEATVADYETCVIAMTKARLDAIASASCENTERSEDDDFIDDDEPEACKTLIDKCPGLW